ncbi:1,4-alpha-glucan branching enzyme [Amycolatopsis jiangsuensis]|uniref:1,4-alpha-glucan branching enzyme n=1 Tax=Amycolatopsis jiangsuensis TaxID=1181879 RepID=A0A840IPI6_9PSEU|nr:isoamylase early set domain-containing protein [Amycolatopsis jiangsuensis]MBB4683098.1 1,4-alpha-glucan branching enzyme [Amycolatopsis jiangsuensis]
MIKTSRGRAGRPAWRVTFILPADAPPGPVSVVGDFNDWQPGRHVLRKRSNGTRSAAVDVPPGARLRFRYLAEGGCWLDDPDVPARDGRDCLFVAD